MTMNLLSVSVGRSGRVKLGVLAVLLALAADVAGLRPRTGAGQQEGCGGAAAGL